MFRKKEGHAGELIAADYLRQLGFNIRDKNVHYNFGELDIVAEKDSILFFFEVRSRKTGLAHPLETINEIKRNKVWRLAENYIMHNKWNGPCEVGYIGIDGSVNPPKIECVLDDGRNI